MVGNMKNHIVELLKALGETADDVAASLHRLGIKGKRGECSECALAVYLQKSSGRPDIRVRRGGVVLANVCLLNFFNDHIHLFNFTASFDAGRYPFLEAE